MTCEYWNLTLIKCDSNSTDAFSPACVYVCTYVCMYVDLWRVFSSVWSLAKTSLFCKSSCLFYFTSLAMAFGGKIPPFKIHHSLQILGNIAYTSIHCASSHTYNTISSHSTYFSSIFLVTGFPLLPPTPPPPKHPLPCNNIHTHIRKTRQQGPWTIAAGTL